MTSRHRLAAGFDRVAAQYERGRPRYAPAAVAFLGRRLRLAPGRTLVELASGTGKLTRDLVPFGAAIVAVEPSAAMRSVFERTVPGTLVVDGTAERIPFPSGSADAVVAAQAAHWFSPAPAGREIARILRPGGTVALLWNVRDRSSAFVRRYERLIDRHTVAPPGRWHHWRRMFRPVGVRFGPMHRRTFRWTVPTTAEAIGQHALSTSRVAALAAPARRRLLAELAELLARDPASRGRRAFGIPTVTEVHWTGRVAASSPRAGPRRRRSGRPRRT